MKTRQLISTISSKGQLTFEVKETELPEPKGNQVIVKIEAAPINPSDLFPMFGRADISQATSVYNDSEKKLTAPVPKDLLGSHKTRFDMPCTTGNEAAGIVVSAGPDPKAQALLGKRVALLSGANFADYACTVANMCLPHKDSTTPQQACSSFVNPLTALLMIETMKAEGHKAMVFTAAASNLGLMLNRACLQEGINIVNIVRKQEQADILNELGAKYIVDSSKASYKQDLQDAIKTTGATLGFDAVGGGQLTSDILAAMEAVLTQDVTGLNTYGAEQHKQVYIYGGLDLSETVLKRAYGMSWGVGGWLMTYALRKLEPSRVAELHKRIANEINTTFASEYSEKIGFKEMLSLDKVNQYKAMRTGEKYLFDPTV
jgi:NADPH:quinone reductase-like Zn-dependent oxidoreductase